jgi:hypothetical protein
VQANSLFSAELTTLLTTQIVSTVAAPTGAGYFAVQIRPSGATMLIALHIP